MINDNFIKRPAAKLEVTEGGSGFLPISPPFLRQANFVPIVLILD